MKKTMSRFTVVQQAKADDKDVAEFKIREAQAAKRAERRAAIEAKTQTISKDGLTVNFNKEKNKSPLAKALATALS